MIENANSEEQARRTKPLGHRSILGTRTRVAARMVVDEDERGRRVANGIAEYFPRMNQARGQGSHRHFFGRDQTVTSVEQQHVEGLSLTIAETPTEVALNIGWAPNRLATLEWFIDDSSRDFDCRTQTRRFRRAESGHRFERWTGGCSEAGEPAKSIERVTPDRPGIALAISGS
jgi:hypothetical protein